METTRRVSAWTREAIGTQLHNENYEEHQLTCCKTLFLILYLKDWWKYFVCLMLGLNTDSFQSQSYGEFIDDYAKDY